MTTLPVLPVSRGHHPKSGQNGSILTSMDLLAFNLLANVYIFYLRRSYNCGDQLKVDIDGTHGYNFKHGNLTEPVKFNRFLFT